jgi:Zn-dependent protease with chaperone function
LEGILVVAGFLLIFLVPQIAFRVQRRFELEADAIAARTLGDGRPVISALEKLAELNLIPGSKGSPTHPSINTRVQRIQQLNLV